MFKFLEMVNVAVIVTIYRVSTDLYVLDICMYELFSY